MLISSRNKKEAFTRRDFLRHGMAAGLGFSLGGLSLASCATKNSDGNQIARDLAELKGSSIPHKVELVQEIYERNAFSPSGIMYSMMHLDETGVRPFVAEDFKGKVWIEANVGKLELEGPWDYLQGENSITASGLYLASQSFRFQATGSGEARAQARRAFHSLDLIYQMGEHTGKPGWMSKPYGFRPSVQTSGDQYLDACWGLWNYHRIADEGDRKRIEQMFINFADYWRSVDYVLDYFGRRWDQKGDTDSYNAVYAMINACAYSFSKSSEHLKQFEWWMSRASWMTQTPIERMKAKVAAELKEKGHVAVVPYGGRAARLAKGLLKPGEFLCWEMVILAKFPVVAADLISQTNVPFARDRLADMLQRWWAQWKYGMTEDFLAYYWFAVDLVNDTWRPLPETEAVPKDQWLAGDPFFSRISQVRWNEPLARFLVVSSIAAKHCPKDREHICDVAKRMMRAVDAKHLHWLLDTDGKQLLPEISYYDDCLSSEVPGSFLASYWKGKCDNLW
jgi:hypothetical protein